MFRLRLAVVNGVLLTGCAAPDPLGVAAPVGLDGPTSALTASPELAPAARFTVPVDTSGVPGRRRHLAPRALWSRGRSEVASLVPALSGATYDRARGGALADHLASLPAERQALGVAGVEIVDLYTDRVRPGGLCEDPLVRFAVEHDGETWQGSLEMSRGLNLGDTLEPRLVALPARCVDALADAGGADGAVGGGCEVTDERAHFPEGSACRACLDVDGDHGRCVGEGECVALAQQKAAGGGAWFDAWVTPLLHCAPDLVSDGIVLVAEGTTADDLAGPFEHDGYEALCIETWDPGRGATRLACDFPDVYGDAIADVVISRLGAVAPPGGGEGWGGRVSIVAELEVEGQVWAGSWLYERTIGNISQTRDQSPLAWSLPPAGRRPDGQTQARDWLAAVVLKTASTRPGVPVWAFNHNRCVSWSDPGEDGAAVCEEVGPWDETEGWLDDGAIGWWDEANEQMIYLPWVTLVSTGLPDPRVPGGVAPHLQGSTALEALEGCAWSETFTPDAMRLLDTNPARGRAPYASFDSQTWRFGREGLDVRVGLLTAQQRGFCFAEP